MRGAERSAAEIPLQFVLTRQLRVPPPPDQNRKSDVSNRPLHVKDMLAGWLAVCWWW